MAVHYTELASVKSELRASQNLRIIFFAQLYIDYTFGRLGTSLELEEAVSCEIISIILV